MRRLCHGHAYQAEFRFYKDGSGKPLRVVHGVVKAADHQNIRKFDSAVVIWNGLAFKRLVVGKTSWDATALAQVRDNESYKM